MSNKQKLEREIVEAMERTELFSNIRLYGDLEIEGNTLTIEYKRSPNILRRDFEIQRIKIEDIIEGNRAMNYPEVNIVFPNHPDEREVYTTKLTRIPLEGSSQDLTTRVLNYILKDIRDNYLWKIGGK